MPGKKRKGRVSHTGFSIVPPVQIHTSPLSQMWYFSRHNYLWLREISQESQMGVSVNSAMGVLIDFFAQNRLTSSLYQQTTGSEMASFPPIYNYKRKMSKLSSDRDRGRGRQPTVFVWFWRPRLPGRFVPLHSDFHLILFLNQNKERGHCLTRCPRWARPPLHTLCFWSCLWGNHWLLTNHLFSWKTRSFLKNQTAAEGVSLLLHSFTFLLEIDLES